MTDPQKRLLYVCLEPARQGHAVFTHVMEMIHVLKKGGYDVLLYTPKYPEHEKLPGFLGRLYQMVKVQYRTFCAMKRGDILYMRWHPLTLFIHLLGKLKKITLVHEVNGPYEDLFIAWPFLKKGRPLFTQMMRLQLKGANHVFPVTQGLANFVKKEGGHARITVVSNGVNTDHFHPKATLPKDLYPLPKRYMIYFGTFAKWHGIQNLLKIATSTFWSKDMDLVIVGDGAFRKDVELASQKNTHIHYMGRVPYDHIPGIIAKAWLSIMPFENTENRADTDFAPLKLFESIACGVPVFSSPVGGLDHFLKTHGCGISMDVSDPDAVARYLHTLSIQDLASYGQKGRKAAQDFFSWKMQGTKVLKVLEDLERVSF